MSVKLKSISQMVLLLLFCFIAGTVSAQTVTGNVIDETGEAVIGATVIEKGTQNATVTDFDGNFTIKMSKGKVLTISYVGMVSQDVNVAGKSNIKVTLKEDNTTLQDVVVVGYGTMKKTDLTGSVGSVGTEDLVAKGSATVMEALQGSVPGVNITQSSSRAGGDFNIEIRGKASTQGSTTPIYVVDGVICDDIQWLNQQDIERIDILKDASSTAIYGSRATAGVVMVTTKGGAQLGKHIQKPSISYDGYYGFSKVVRTPDFQNGDQFYKYRFSRFLLTSGDSKNWAQPIYTMENFGQMALETSTGSGVFVMKQMLESGKTVDWPDIVTRNGSQQNHFVTVNGASESVRYHFGLGYAGLKGIYEGDKESKINFKGSVDADINKYVTAGFSFNMAKIDNTYASDNGVQEAYRMNPFMVPYDDEGNLKEAPGNKNALGTDANQFTSSINPLLYWRNETHERETWRLLGNVYVELKPISGLTFKTSFAPSYTNYREGYFSDTLTGDETNHAHIINSRSFSWTWDNVLTYEKTFNDIHRINVMGLISAESGNSESSRIYSAGVLDNTLWWNLNSNDAVVVTDTKNSYSESSMLSYALRANYTLLDRYMFTATVRWDGSSKFADGHRWGSFPSAAFAWRLSEEPFMESTKNWLSNLKLRVSYGATGNNKGISNYATYVTVAKGSPYPLAGKYVTSSYPSGVVNSAISWEKSHEINLGVDFGFLNNRIHGSIDWYNKKSTDLLYDLELPLSVGGGTMSTNIGSVRNRGIEIALTTVNIQNKDWYWETSFSFAHNKNEVLEINGSGTDVVPSGLTGGLFIGEPYNNVYSYVWDGIVSDRIMTVPDNEIARIKGFTPGSEVRECDYYYACYGWTEGMAIIQDKDGNGSFDNNDKKIYSSAPKWTGSFSTTLSYKGWDLGATLYAKVGYDVYSPFLNRYLDLSDRGRMRMNEDWYIPAGTLIDADGYNADGTLINPVYQESTHYGSYPFPNHSATGGGGGSYWLNAASVVDASFLKVKNISLGYTFPKNWINKFGCQNLRLYCTVTNPFVFTKYQGFDPEWASTSLKNDGPSTVTWQFGANIKF